MNGFSQWLAQLQWDKMITMGLFAAAALLSITVHELCHGLAALALGDPTAKRAGRLSLNPLKHLDLVGLVLLVAARVGWAKPVPINPGYFKNPRLGMAVTAVAGPVSNVLLGAAAVVLYTVFAVLEIHLGQAFFGYLANLFYYVLYISVGLAVFNLLPLPPLDGSKILFAILPEELYWKLMRYERYGMLAVVALLLTGTLDGVLDFLREGLMGLMLPLNELTLELMLNLMS